MLLVFVYVFAVSFVLNKAIKWGKIRNTLLVGLAGFGFGLFADYIGWVAWIAAMAKDPSYLIEFFFPWEVASIIIEVGKQGAWSFEGSTPSGAFLYFIWLLEAIAVVGGITYSTLNTFSETPFCEDSDKWVEKKKILGYFFPLTDLKRFKASISQGDLSVFNELKVLQTGNEYTMFELYECEDCRNFFVLNIKSIKITIDRRRRRNQQTKTIVKNLLLAPSALSGITRMIQTQTSEMTQQRPTA